MDLEQENSMRDLTISNYTDNKFNKEKELNASMSISPSSPDEYDREIHNLKGGSE